MNKGKNSSLNNKDRNELTRTMSNAILAGQFSEKHQMNPKHKTHGSSFASGHKVYKCESFLWRHVQPILPKKLAVTAQEFLFPFENIYCCRYGTYLQVNCFFYP